jgi:hypothetical protein
MRLGSRSRIRVTGKFNLQVEGPDASRVLSTVRGGAGAKFDWPGPGRNRDDLKLKCGSLRIEALMISELASEEPPSQADSESLVGAAIAGCVPWSTS